MAIHSTSGPTNHHEMMPLVGRDAVQAALQNRLTAANCSQGQVILIGGEAGIGKTTLVRWLAATARQSGVNVHTGQAYDLTLTPPYGVWVEALADTWSHDELHRLEPVRDPAMVDSQSLLFDRIRLHLSHVTANQTRLIVLEDVHWTDPASLELLRFLAPKIERLRLAIVVTYRNDELTRGHPLAQTLPLLVRESAATRIDLQTLTNDDALALVRNRYTLASADEARLAGWLQSRGSGNPFFLTEMLRTLESERIVRPTSDGWQLGELDRSSVPFLVRQIVERRLNVLDDDTRAMLDSAAVIGQDVPIDIWQAVCDGDVAEMTLAIERAVAARLILRPEQVTTVSFTHALVRETLYDALPLTRRQRLHQRVAESLAGRTEPPAADVASHFGQAGDPRAIAWLVRAGEQALAFGAGQDAIAALNWAHDLAVRFGQALPIEAYRSRASAYAMRGEFDSARRDYELTLDRARVATNSQAEWQALIDLASMWSGMDYERAGDYCQAALDVAQSIDDVMLIAHSLNQLANWHVNNDEPDVGVSLHQRALAMFEQAGDQPGIAETLDLLGMANYVNGMLTDSARDLERAATLFRTMGDRQRLASCLAALVFLGGELGGHIAVPVYRETGYWIHCGEESLKLATEIAWPAGQALALFALANGTGIRGEPTRALAFANEGYRIAERIGHHEWLAGCRLISALIKRDLLDLPGAIADAEQALTTARVSGSIYWISSTTTAAALVQLSNGELDRAAATIGAVAQPDGLTPSPGQRASWYVLAELALARDEPDRAKAILLQLTRYAGVEDPLDGPPGLVALLGRTLARLGQFDEAQCALTAARDRTALFGYLPMLWRIDAARGEVYMANGRTAEAEAACRSAAATIDSIAARIEATSVRNDYRSRALSHLPIAPNAAAESSDLARLSPRELDVLRLVVHGMSDREIAAELHISPRTVMRHVTGILTKLDAPSRTAAAARAVRQGIA